MENFEMTRNADQNTEVPLQGNGRRPLNMNSYANMKSVAESMLDVALLMANFTQLKLVIDQGPDLESFKISIILISLSIILQVVVAIMLIIIFRCDLNDESNHYKLNILETIATVFILFIVVINTAITAVGFHKTILKFLTGGAL